MIGTDDFDRITDSAKELDTIPFYIDDTSSLSGEQLADRARKLKDNRGLDLLVIDNLDALQDMTNRIDDSRKRNNIRIGGLLKNLARELDIVVLGLSHLPEARNRRLIRPKLGDINKALEPHADVIFFIFREDHYLLSEEPSAGTAEHIKWMAEMEACHGRTEILVAKNRNGSLGSAQLQFDTRLTSFYDLL
jgi:replicative DNA helicase